MGVGRHRSHGNGREWESKYCSHTPLTQSDSQLAARGDAACLPPLPWQLDFFVFNIVIHVSKNTTVASRGKRNDSR